MDLETALKLDELGEWDRVDEIYQTLSAECQKDPNQKTLMLRFLNFLAVMDRGEELQDWLEGYLESVGEIDKEVCDGFVLPAAAALMEMGDLARCFRIMQKIPQSVAKQSKVYGRFHRDFDRFFAFYEDQNGTCVPWHRLNTQWWLQPQKLELNRGDLSLVRWYAARFVDEADDDVELYVTEIEYGKPSRDNRHHMLFERGEWEKSGGSKPHEMQEFYEIGMYSGGGSATRIIEPLYPVQAELELKISPAVNRYETGF